MNILYRWNDKIKVRTKDGQYLTEKEIEKRYLLVLKDKLENKKEKVKVKKYE